MVDIIAETKTVPFVVVGLGTLNICSYWAPPTLLVKLALISLSYPQGCPGYEADWNTLFESREIN